MISKPNRTSEVNYHNRWAVLAAVGMGAAPKQQLGIVSGLLSITRTLGQTTGITVLGALWAARTSLYTGREFSIESKNGHIEAQLQALHDTILAIIIIVGISVILSVWSILIERFRRVSE